MNRLSALVLALGLVCGPALCAPLADHVVLISVDGFRPEFYRDPAWPAPTIQQLARDGAHAEGARGVFPSVTYPSHTTMVTGVFPRRHGVLFNRPFEPEGQTGRWYWDYSAVQVPTLWTVLRAAGAKTASVSWPVTSGAPIDWTIPEIWALEGDDRLKPMRDNTQPLELWSELEQNATGRLNRDNYSTQYIGRDDETGQIAAYLLETYRPALLAVHLLSTDHFQHEEGREADSVKRSVAAVDNAIRMIVEAAERAGTRARTAFIVTGDHGFVDLTTELAPNVWLRDAGLLEDAPDRGAWRAAFHCEGGAAFLRLKDPEDSEALTLVQDALNAQPNRVTKLFRLVNKPELDAAGADPDSFAALAAGLDVTFSERTSGDAVGPATGATHGHFPTDFDEILTGFVASGSGIEAGRTIHQLGLEDIAPLVAELLDVEMPADIDGNAPLGILIKADEE